MSDELAQYIWKYEYSVGNDEIDRQHMRIFSVCQQVHDLPDVLDKAALESFHEALDAAARFAREHFHYEEHVLRKANYPELAEHQREHEQFRGELADLLSDAVDGKISPERFAKFLSNWLTNHILITDMKFKSHIHAK